MLKKAIILTVKFMLMVVLFLALLFLNWKMWVKDRDQERLIKNLQTEHKIQLEENAKMRETNATLRAHIDSLKRGSVEMIEEEARDNFGMVREGVTYYDFKPDSQQEN